MGLNCQPNKEIYINVRHQKNYDLNMGFFSVWFVSFFVLSECKVENNIYRLIEFEYIERKCSCSMQQNNRSTNVLSMSCSSSWEDGSEGCSTD